MITGLLEGRKGPAVIATDYIQAHSELLRGFIPKTYRVLGTDGFGRSDTRAQLRNHFEVDRKYVCLAALKALADDGEIDKKLVVDAIKKYGIDPEKADPMTL